MNESDAIALAVKELKNRGASITPEVLGAKLYKKGSACQFSGVIENEYWDVWFKLHNVPEGFDEESFSVYIYPDGRVEVPDLL